MSDIWIIEGKPKPDMVEVVRCRDCKYADPTQYYDEGLFCACLLEGMKPDDFCSYGEKRRDDHD